jgi:hypothetical protein
LSFLSCLQLATGGVQVDYRYTRHPHLYAADMLAIELTLTNHASEDSGEVKVCKPVRHHLVVARAAKPMNFRFFLI